MEIQIGTQKEKCFVDSFDPNVLFDGRVRCAPGWTFLQKKTYLTKNGKNNDLKKDVRW